MPSYMSIRAADDADLSAVLRLWQEAKVTPPGPTDSLQGLTRLIRHPGGVLMIAVIDGSIVGSVIGGWDGWRASIYRLAVTPAYRRRGIARELVAAVSSAVRERRRADIGVGRARTRVGDGLLGFLSRPRL
jgi:ribosomal protein S18 acetylase RimI-like enzyme